MRVFITGSAGFIGFHLSRLLLKEGHQVFGFDGMTDYYDIDLKRRRHELLAEYSNFCATEGMLEDRDALAGAVDAAGPEVIVHLAAQAGVRFSIDNPRAYLEANVDGTFNVLEAARLASVKHLLLASTSSVYGANKEMPYREVDVADTPMSFYAATKKAGEALSHSWAHIYGVPITAFRFFTVYGPWGRPDMALFKFTKSIFNDAPIDVYNNGNMSRDFTFIDDLVRAIRLLIEVVPTRPDMRAGLVAAPGDTLSPVAPWRVVNIGNSTKVSMAEFIEAIEAATGRVAVRNLMPMQPGDVPATWADASLLNALTGYKPATDIKAGVSAFVDWYRTYELELANQAVGIFNHAESEASSLADSEAAVLRNIEGDCHPTVSETRSAA